MKTILVTGAAGYIGSVLVNQLLKKKYKVIGFDILNFGGESLLSVYNHPNFEFIKGDIRLKDEIEPVLQKVDAVVHLAAIVGDPACAKDPKISEETNWLATKMIYDLCNDNDNVKRFVFASTCSNYGKMEGDGFVNEESPLNPVSLYAKLKVRVEEYIAKTPTRNDFTTTALRFSTVYGISPRIRFDLTVNEFVRDLTSGKELVIFGEQFWRPYCHVEDLAQGCIAVLESESEKVDKNVFGVGDTSENYSKKMLAENMLKVIPDAVIKYVHKDEDPRDYRVDFTKIKKELDFSITRNVPDSIYRINKLLKSGLLLNPYDKKYQNI